MAKGTTAKHNCRSQISEHRPRVTFEASLEDLGEEGGLARAGNWSDEVVGGKEGGGSVAIAGEDPDGYANGTDDVTMK